MVARAEISLLQKISIALICLSLLLPWASNWNLTAHVFLYGQYFQRLGFITYDFHWRWVIPLFSFMFGIILVFVGLFSSLAQNIFYIIIGSNIILYAGEFFNIWMLRFFTGGEIVVMESFPSFGFFISIIGSIFLILETIRKFLRTWGE